LAKRGRPGSAKADPRSTTIGVLRHIFVADTDEEAKRSPSRAWNCTRRS